MCAIEVNNLSFAYSDGRVVLSDISFSVCTGETFLIAGPSGSGKTTLCHILCGIIPHAIKGNLKGEITVIDINPAKADLPQTSLRIGMVFQDADSQLICTTVEDELAFGLENLCWSPEEIRSRVEELIEEFGFDTLRHVNPTRLSTGEKKLLTIAAVLAPSPPILVLDEPMRDLDSDGRKLVQTAIRKQQENGCTVIIAEHDLKKVPHADRWIQLDQY